MTFQLDDSAVLAALTLLPAQIAIGMRARLADGALIATEIMQTSPAHGDQSGAAHASSIAVVLGPDAQAELDRAYGIAEQLLEGFTGHTGKAQQIDAPVLPPDQVGILLARPVDYAEDLEHEGKAVVGPTLQETHDFFTRLAAEGAREALE